MKIVQIRIRGRGHGFARIDALMAVFSLILLGLVAWGGVWLGGESRRIWVCQNHLKQLGEGFTRFTQDHGGALPPAALIDGTNSTSWDVEIAPYLEPKVAKPVSPATLTDLKAKTAYLFKCPSDREPHGGELPRSYSMPMYDLNHVSWPPDQDSLGGLGLYLDGKVLKKVRDADPTMSPDAVPAIKTAMVPDPYDTALLVERISIVNALLATKYACIVSTREQFDAKTFAAKDYHGGRLNYLMLDGHVELLLPIQSGGHTGSGDQGLWTIRPGD